MSGSAGGVIEEEGAVLGASVSDDGMRGSGDDGRLSARSRIRRLITGLASRLVRFITGG